MADGHFFLLIIGILSIMILFMNFYNIYKQNMMFLIGYEKGYNSTKYDPVAALKNLQENPLNFDGEH